MDCVQYFCRFMNIRKVLLFISIICSFLFITLSYKMINGQAEYGSSFGLRIEQTMDSKPEWYRMNQIAGWAILIASAVMLFGSSLLFGFGRKLSKGKYIGLFIALLFGSALIAAAITSSYA